MEINYSEINTYEKLLSKVTQIKDYVLLTGNKMPTWIDIRNDLGKEFFERRERRHPVWKSEAEYKAFILELATGGSLLQDFEMAMSLTAKYLIKSTDSWVIDDALISKLEKEIAELETMFLDDEETRKVQVKDKAKILKVMHSLQSYAKEKNLECSFVILMASQFNSGFGKADFSEINVVFKTKEGEKIAKFGEIVSSLKAKNRDRDSFFYLFYNIFFCIFPLYQ